MGTHLGGLCLSWNNVVRLTDHQTLIILLLLEQSDLDPHCLAYHSVQILKMRCCEFCLLICTIFLTSVVETFKMNCCKFCRQERKKKKKRKREKKKRKKEEL